MSHRAFVLATGPSLTQDDVDAVRGQGLVVAVSDAWRMAPWCDVLVSTDAAWWDLYYAKVKGLGCKKWRATQPARGDACRVPILDGSPSGFNSGALGMLAAKAERCDEVVLLGFDMSDKKGEHFFGAHPKELKRTLPATWRDFHAQFSLLAQLFSAQGVRVVNCSRDTCLKSFPRATLEDVLNGGVFDG